VRKPEEKVGKLSVDERFMRMALREAERGAREGEVPVGAVLVGEGRVLARAHNRPIQLRDPSAHAEILVVRRAARKLGNYRLEGYDLYVTIEPCAMCVGAIVQARLRRVIFGAQDPKAGACGSALRVLNHRKLNHRIELTRGVLAAECALVIQKFFRLRRKKASVATSPSPVISSR
jgi:tRNA(adenine34) deaminase